jgi:hypothetical protein
VWPTVRALAERQHGAVSAGQLLAAGVSRSYVSRLVQRGHVRRALAGVYVLAGQDERVSGGSDSWATWSFATRLTAGLLAHGGDAVVVLRSAAELHGFGWLPPDPRGTVHLALPPGNERHQQPGLRVHTLLLRPDEVGELDWLGRRVRVTTPRRTAVDLLCTYAHTTSVPVLDWLRRTGGMTDGALIDLGAALYRRRGACRAREAIRRSDPRSESPLESVLRVIAHDGGLPPDDLQRPITDGRGRLLARADLVWVRSGRRSLLAEADGRLWHDAPPALLHDRRRANALSALGDYDVVRFTWADTRHPAYVVGVLRAHLSPRS